uniref:Uncharacterized protein n=1 Tax=viral metagenome TaxID=1070528 RepID=A0A6C0H4C5_9ZZZZ
MCSTSFMYDSESPAMYLKSMETKYNIIDKQVFEETEKKIVDMLTQIIVQNQKIQEMLEKTNE